MVCGPSGVGKTSFVELFMVNFNLQEANKILESKQQNWNESLIDFPYNKQVIKEGTTEIETKEICSKKEDSQFVLSLVDTPGYGN